MMCRFPAGVALGALLGSTAFLSSLSAFAQTAPAANPPQAPAPSAAAQGAPVQRKPGMNDINPNEKAAGALKAFFDAKVAGLHAGLELTPEQAPLWTPVEAAIRDVAKAHADAHRQGVDKPTDALGQLKHMSEQLIRGGQAMKALADATGPLLTTLSEDQKERLPKLLEGMQPKKILAKAFDLPEDRDAYPDERDSDEGHRDYGHHRHNDQADADRGPRHGSGEEGRDDEGWDHNSRGRDFGDRNLDNYDFGNRFYRDHDRHGERDRGEDETERQHDDHDGFGRDRRGSEGFRHRQDSEDERT